MINRACSILCLSLLLFSATARSEEPAAKIVVDLSAPGPAFPRTLHGIFFEDINYAADAGLYAELVQNRSFEHRERMFAWTALGDAKLSIADERPLNAHNGHFLRIQAAGPGVGAVNSGYGGIHLMSGQRYQASLYARTQG